MPPQIKQDLNRSGWETTDFPSVCENVCYTLCLPQKKPQANRVTTVSSREPLRPDAQTRLLSRMQTVHPSIHRLHLENRPNLALKVHRHLPHLRSTEELLPMLHA